jgi:hypothetical protein
MRDWIVIVVEGQQVWGAKVYGPFKSEEVAQALARGFQAGGGKTAYATRLEEP